MRLTSKLALLFGAFLMAAPVAADPVSRVTAAQVLSGSLVVKPGTAILTGANVVTGTTPGFLMVFDSPTVPADGAVTPKRCMPVAANTGLEINWRSSPLYFQNGAVLVFSSGANCFTKAISATAYLAGDIQ